VFQPQRLKDEDWLDTFRSLGADIGVVAAYGKILPQALLDIPPRGLVNVHASLLPAYRGASPIHRAVMDGEPETGVTIMRVVLALDAGPMLARASLAIGDDETSADVETRLAPLGARLLVDTLDAIAAGTAVETPQDDARATYAPRLTKEEGTIDWSLPARAIHNRVRGLHPWPRAWTTIGLHRLVVLRGSAAQGVESSPGAAPGVVLEAHGDRFVVAAGEGTAYRLTELQPEGRRAMAVREFLAGHPVAAGTRLGAS
jgi:methionyl-tRNA formyltransferase